MKYKFLNISSFCLTIFLLILISTSNSQAADNKNSLNVVNTNYQYQAWGQYQTVTINNEKYFPLATNKVDKVAKLVIDRNDKFTLKTGDKFDMGDGYTLLAKQLDFDGKKVWLEFDKDGVYIDDRIVSTDTGEEHTWTCTVDTQGESGVPVLKVHVGGLSQDAVDSIATIDGLWLIDYQDGTTVEDITQSSNPTTVTTPADVVYNTVPADVTQSSTPTTVTTPTPIPQPLIAGFTSSLTSGYAPLKVTFTDTSTGLPTSWSWDFGDGSSSVEQNPTHTYPYAGTYTIKLTATNDAGSDTANNLITVLIPPTEQEQTIPTEKPQLTPTEQPLTASVNLYGEKTDVVKGEDIQLKLSAVNIITKPSMHTQVILIPPSGMSVSSSDFVESGAGQYTTTYDLEPGKGKDIEVKIAGNQVGDFDVKGTVIYYFGNNKKDFTSQELDLPIHVSENNTSPSPISTPSPSHSIITISTPGFGAIGLVFMILVVFLIRRSKV